MLKQTIEENKVINSRDKQIREISETITIRSMIIIKEMIIEAIIIKNIKSNCFY